MWVYTALACVAFPAFRLFVPTASAAVVAIVGGLAVLCLALWGLKGSSVGAYYPTTAASLATLAGGLMFAIMNGSFAAVLVAVTACTLMAALCESLARKPNP